MKCFSSRKRGNASKASAVLKGAISILRYLDPWGVCLSCAASARVRSDEDEQWGRVRKSRARFAVLF